MTQTGSLSPLATRFLSVLSDLGFGYTIFVIVVERLILYLSSICQCLARSRMKMKTRLFLLADI